MDGSLEPASSPASRLADPEVLHKVDSGAGNASSHEDAKERRMAQAVADQMSMPMTVHQVRLHGATNTRRGFLEPMFASIFGDEASKPSTVGEVMDSLRILSARLSGLQILKQPPEFFMDASPQTNPGTTPSDVDVDIRVHELPRFKLQTGTDVGNGEGSAYGSLLWRNMFGGAEMLTLNAKAGTRTRSAYSANLSAPVLSNPDMRISLEAMASAAEKPWASHEEVLKGGSTKFSWLDAQRDSHSIEYSGTWRQITGLAATASPTVRTDAGDSIKSAIKYTHIRERRDNPQLPQSGYMVRSGLELAGVGPLGGDVAFSKGELEMGGAVPIPLPGRPGPSGMSIGGGFRMGMLWPLPIGFDLFGKAPPSRLNDRFQLGGPTDVRGFKLGGIGPHDGQDSVGGDMFAAGSVNLLMPLPYKGPESAMRFQVFANGGRLVALKSQDRRGETSSAGLDVSTVRRGMFTAMRELVTGRPTVAAGVGLVYAHPVARFELNFSLPVDLRRGEVGTKGFQVGVGINLL
ncbi:outer membrane protein [Stachybotrys elegans]|uniref:Outer membrane protein n=1 Tax=Stachybotrys elegans TaxID=80388 RepID=A0A8K0SLR2_9HYPO|nr:outer membrane protein [Stachybotrys elegans]